MGFEQPYLLTDRRLRQSNLRSRSREARVTRRRLKGSEPGKGRQADLFLCHK
jgi:hypothetical protein